MPVQEIGFKADELLGSLGKQVQAFTIAVAEDALRQEVAKGFDNQPVVVTDGVPRRDYAQVRPFGKVEFIARPQMFEAVSWALTELQKRSPVLTGRYASSHMVLINGAEVMGDIAAALKSVKPTDRVQIVNPQPYARKIEGATANARSGRAKRKGSSSQARNGVYRPVLAALVTRYGKSMFFDFKYVKLNTGVKVWGNQGGGYIRKKYRLDRPMHPRRVLRDQVYPALQFFIKPTDLPN